MSEAGTGVAAESGAGGTGSATGGSAAPRKGKAAPRKGKAAPRSPNGSATGLSAGAKNSKSRPTTSASIRKRKEASQANEPRYFDRDEGWMLFNRRVLEEAEDASNPLLERVKFLAITASNLDEFVEIRVASLLQHIEDGYTQPQRRDEGGLSLQQRLERLSVVLHDFVDAQYACMNQKLLPALSEEKIRILKWRELSDRART